MKKITHSLLLTLTALIWGFAFVAQSEGGDAIGPYSFNCLRSIIAAIFLYGLYLIFKKIDPKSVKGTKQDYIKAAICCGGSLTLATITQQLGITLGHSVGKAGFLTACYIVLVPILGLFLKKKCPKNVYISVVIGLIGLYMLCMKGDFTVEFSDFLLLACALFFSIQILCVDYFAPILNPVLLSCIQFFTVFILSAIPMILFEMKDIALWIEPFTRTDAWFPLLFAGVMSSGVAYTLQIVSQKELNPTLASLIMSLESVFSAIGGWLILKQVLTTKEILGCMIVFAAIILAQLPEKKKV